MGMTPARARRSTYCSAALVEFLRNCRLHTATHTVPKQTYTPPLQPEGITIVPYERRWSGKERTEILMEERERRKERTIIMTEKHHYAHSFCFIF